MTFYWRVNQLEGFSVYHKIGDPQNHERHDQHEYECPFLNANSFFRTDGLLAILHKFSPYLFIRLLSVVVVLL